MTSTTNKHTSQGAGNAKSETTPHLGSEVLYHLPKAVSPLPRPARTFIPFQAYLLPSYRWLRTFCQPLNTVRLPAGDCSKLQPSPPISNPSPSQPYCR